MIPGFIVSLVSLLFVLQTQQTFSMAQWNSKRLLLQDIIPFSLAEVSSNGETYPSVAMFSEGSFIVVFQGVDAGSTEIFAQLYNANGIASGSRFQVNTYVIGTQQRASVASLLNGKFIVAWTSVNQDGNGNEVYAQILNADGTKSGTEFRVNTEIANSQEYPDIATLTTGKFVISWESYMQDGYVDGVYAQIFNEDGTKSGTEFLVNTHILGNQRNLAVTALAAGKFVITWSDNIQEGTDGIGIYAQIFNGDGTKNGGEFHVNTNTLYEQNYPGIATLSTGRFIIVWLSSQSDGTWRLYGQIYNSDGSAFGSEFPASSGTVGSQLSPTIIPNTEGGFAILFRDANNEINTRIFGSDGVPIGPDFAIGLFSSSFTSGIFLKNGLGLAVGQLKDSGGTFTGIGAKSFCLSQSPLSDTSCFACWSAQPYLYNQQCYATCPSAASKSYNNECYANCPSQAPYSYGQECYIACPAAAPYSYGEECYVACPAAAPRIEDNVCTKSLPMVIIKTQEQLASAAVVATSVMNASNSFFVLLASLSNMFLYIRYLRINYPENIKAMFVEQDVELFSISLSIDIPDTIEDKLPQRPLPDVFEAYDVKSSFLSNLWGPIMTLLVVLAATLVIMLFVFLTRKWGRLNAVFRKLSSWTKWNMPLLVICGNYCDVIFYLSMEFRTSHFDSPLPTISFMTCVSMIIISMLVLFKTITIVRNIQQTKHNKRLKKNWKDFTILYDEYKENSYFTLAYLLIFFGRDTIFNLLIANEFDYPLTQTILFTCLSIFMVVYLVLVRPFKSMLQFFQIFANEIILLILNVCVLILAILDKKDSEAVEARNNIGEVIIIINLIFSSANLLFLLIAMVQQLIGIYKKYKEAKAKGMSSWKQIIKYIFSEEEEGELDPSKSVKPSKPRIRRETSVLRSSTTSYLKSDIADTPQSQLVNSPDAFQDLTNSQLNSSDQIISKLPARMTSIKRPREDERKAIVTSALTHNHTDMMKSNVADVNSSQIESSPGYLRSNYYTQRPSNTSNSILADLNSSDINLIGRHDLSPENMLRFDWGGSKPSSLMNKRIESRKEELGNVDLSPYMKKLRDIGKEAQK